MDLVAFLYITYLFGLVHPPKIDRPVVLMGTQKVSIYIYRFDDLLVVIAVDGLLQMCSIYLTYSLEIIFLVFHN